MGEKRLVNKSISPAEVARALQSGSITVAQAQALYNGVMPIGDYKGRAAILDIDKLVVQPLVQSEKLYALDKLDARDIITANLIVGTLVDGTIRARTTAVPAGEVWFINRIAVVVPVQTGAEAIVQANFRISTWAIPDIRTGVTPDADGRSYWPADVGAGAAATFTADLPAQGELGEELRLPAGAVITLVATATVAGCVTVAKACTLTMFGRKGKLLVA